MRRVLVAGSSEWTDRRATTAAFKRVMQVYRPPYTLIVDDSGDGTARFAAATARELGWKVETYEVDTKCAVSCPPGHRRAGGPRGDWCPLGKRRSLVAQLDTMPDLFVVFKRPAENRRTTDERIGQSDAKQRGIAVWQYTQRKDNRGNT